MRTFRIHYTINSHRHTFDMRGENPNDIRERFPKYAVRIHGKDPSMKVLKVKLLRNQHA